MITIEVRGLPAPQGSKRHVGHGVMVESSKAVGPWRESVRAETQRVFEIPGEHQLGWKDPVEVAITFRLPRPKSHYRTGRNAHLVKDGAPRYPDGKPDEDKLKRAVNDGLTAGGAFWDDAQIVHSDVWKVYAGPGQKPGADIVVTEL